ncbi:MAG: hypothetical protein KDC11_10215 [Chitinophagaceae bacterium]|nr:hypothetical protein [Chitinophagaceae bacterium]
MKRGVVKRFIAAAIFTVSAVVASAQAPEGLKESNAHVGVIYPISTNGTEALKYSNKFSIHLIGGASGQEEAFCASGFGNFIKNDGNGLIAAGFGSVIMGDAQGAQLSGFANYIHGYAEGFQGAGFANVADVSEGVQAAGFANVNLGSIRGTQIAGAVNVAECVDGFQGAGYINVAKDVRGAQAAGFVNVAGDIKGTQIAGYVNVSGDVNSQIAGFINVAKNVKGVQLAGFINVAETSDYPIGLVNVSRNGEKFLGVTVDDNMTTLATFRSGGKYLYGLVGAGTNLTFDEPAYALEVGLGAHIPLAKIFRINTEVAVTSLTDFWNTLQVSSSFRLLPALKLGNRFEIFAGPTYNYEYSEYSFYRKNISTQVWSNNDVGYSQRMYIGGLAGIHFDI